MQIKKKSKLGMKITAVIFAVLIWLLIYINDNPIETRQFSIALTPINEEYLLADNLRILNEYDKEITISVKGRKPDLDTISEKDFMAYLDFSAITDEYDEYIDVTDLTYLGEKNISRELVGSGRIGLSIDRIVAGEVPIKVTIMGEPAEGFIVVGTTVKPANYAILDIKSLVQDIDSAVVDVDVTGLKGTKTVRKFCMVYDSTGKLINELSNSTAIDVTVNIAKSIPVVVKIEGMPAFDHLQTMAVAEPSEVLVSGFEEDLKKLESISTLPVNIEGAEDTFTVSSGLISLPAGTGFVGTGEVSVEVTIEGIYEKTIGIVPSYIVIRWGMPTQKIYEILNNNYEVTVKGRQSILDIITAAALSPYIDVSEVEDGSVSLPLRFDNLDEVEQVSFPLVELYIQSKMNIKIATDDISISNRSGGLYDYSFAHPEETMMIRGLGENIALINPDNLRPGIDVGTLGAGSHEVPVKVSLPPGVEFINDLTTIIVITEK